MKRTFVSAVSALALGSLSVSSPLAAEDALEEPSITYDDALKCSALYSFLAAASDGEPEGPALLDVAVRWLTLAMDRDGSEDGSVAEAALGPKTDDMIAALEEMGENEAQVEAFLEYGIEFCAGKQGMVAEEFDAIEVE